MALDEAKVEYAIGRSQVLEERLDVLIGAIESEREEMGRRFELHGEAIKQSNARTIKEEIAALETRITERVDLLVSAQTAGQCSDIDSMKESIDDIKVHVDAIDTRTRDFPLVRGKLEQLEARPGQMAIKAWQWLAVGGVSLIGVIFSAIALFKNAIPGG